MRMDLEMEVPVFLGLILCVNLCEKKFQNLLKCAKIGKNKKIQNLMILNTSFNLRRLGSSEALLRIRRSPVRVGLGAPIISISCMLRTQLIYFCL
jgi:hypothetical protein